MGSTCRRGCSRNRRLAPRTVWIPIVAADAEQVEGELEERPGHGSNLSFCALQASFLARTHKERCRRTERVAGRLFEDRMRFST